MVRHGVIAALSCLTACSTPGGGDPAGERCPEPIAAAPQDPPDPAAVQPPDDNEEPHEPAYEPPQLQSAWNIEASKRDPPERSWGDLVVRVVPYETETSDPELQIRVEAERTTDGKTFQVERPASFATCTELILRMKPIYVDEENLVADAQFVCHEGSTVFREFVDHTIVHVVLSPVLDDYGTISSIFEGKSVSVDNRGLALVSDRLEFHVEGRELVVYRESVSWCDKELMVEAMGDDNCPKPEKRTLTELERLGL